MVLTCIPIIRAYLQSQDIYYGWDNLLKKGVDNKDGVHLWRGKKKGSCTYMKTVSGRPREARGDVDAQPKTNHNS